MTENKLNVYRALQTMRVALQKKDIKKSGYNDYGKFAYFELSDFLPAINELALENNIVCLYRLEDKDAVLRVADIDDNENGIDFRIPIAEVSTKGANAIQIVGSLTTYTRRYLYMIAFEIAENDDYDRSQRTVDEDERKEQIKKSMVDKNNVEALRRMLERTSYDESVLLKHYKINDLYKLTFEQWQSAMSQLENRADKVSEGGHV